MDVKKSEDEAWPGLYDTEQNLTHCTTQKMFFNDISKNFLKTIKEPLTQYLPRRHLTWKPLRKFLHQL